MTNEPTGSSVQGTVDQISLRTPSDTTGSTLGLDRGQSAVSRLGNVPDPATEGGAPKARGKARTRAEENASVVEARVSPATPSLGERETLARGRSSWLHATKKPRKSTSQTRKAPFAVTPKTSSWNFSVGLPSRGGSPEHHSRKTFAFLSSCRARTIARTASFANSLTKAFFHQAFLGSCPVRTTTGFTWTLRIHVWDIFSLTPLLFTKSLKS